MERQKGAVLSMKNNCPDALKKAVKEYYEWHGDKRAFAIALVKTKDKNEMLLAHFEDGSTGKKMSTLMWATGWADGHWDVKEEFLFPRECEAHVLQVFRNSTLDEFGADEYETYDGHDREEDGDLSEWSPENEVLHEEEVMERKQTFDGGYDDDDYEEGMIL